MEKLNKMFHSIILVDDDDTSNFISQNVINNLGITQHIQTLKNGKQALDYLEENYDDTIGIEICPDLILLDVNMPVMDGFQFLEKFYENNTPRYEDVKIVLLTSSSNPQDVESSRKYPIHGYISKPLTTDKLIAVVSRIV